MMETNDLILELANMLGITLIDIHAIYAEAIAGIALINLIGFVIFCISMVITFRIMVIKTVSKNESSDYESDQKRNSLFKFDFEEDFVAIIILMLCAFFIIGISCTICTEAVQHYIYPEYFAIEQMLMPLR